MKAAIFKGKGSIVVEERPKPPKIVRPRMSGSNSLRRPPRFVLPVLTRHLLLTKYASPPR